MKNSTLVVLASLFGTLIALCFVFFVFPFAIVFGFTSALLSLDTTGVSEADYVVKVGEENYSDAILSIDVTGVILGESPGSSGFFDSLTETGVTYGYEVKNQLILATDNADIKGVVLEIDSPGGTIYGSQAILEGVTYYKETTGNPVVAFVKGSAASGGYWAAIGADYIMADYGSSVGSIGVLLGPIKYYDGLIAEDGGLFFGGVETSREIDAYYITSGEGKDAGSPYRELTAKEISIFQEGSDNEYDEFVRLVSENRDLTVNEIRNEIGAHVYDNKTAIEIGLMDETGSQSTAYNKAAELAELDGFSVVYQSNEVTTGEALLSIFRGNENPSPLITFCGTRQILAFAGDLHQVCGI